MRQITKYGTKQAMQFAFDQIEKHHQGVAIWKKKKRKNGEEVFAVFRTDMNEGDLVSGRKQMKKRK